MQTASVVCADLPAPVSEGACICAAPEHYSNLSLRVTHSLGVMETLLPLTRGVVREGLWNTRVLLWLSSREPT